MATLKQRNNFYGSLQTFKNAWREGGFGLVVHRAEGRWFRQRNSMRRKFKPRPLELMLNSRWSVTRSAAEALALISAHRPELGLLPSYAAEVIAAGHEQLKTIKVSEGGDGNFSEAFDVEVESSLLIYAICRILRPNIVVETGVARGLSTAMILSAMDTEGIGHLHSFDVESEVGSLVPESLRKRWTLWHLGDDEDPQRGLASALHAIGKCQIFLHDSDHSTVHQRFEYSLAARVIDQQGLLLSDDVEGNDAMEETCPGNWHLIALSDVRKVFGIALLPTV